MNDQINAASAEEPPRVEYDGRPLGSFDKSTLIEMIADLIAQLDVANGDLAMVRREIERTRATAGKGFNRGR
ncbi:MAG TPA: hypothetical protein VIQ53_12360 [Inquilinus sp.]